MTPDPRTPDHGPNRWSNTFGKDEWHVEIEPDRFAPDEPFCVSVWIEGVEADANEREFSALATCTPEQAREMASALTRFADYVEGRNTAEVS